MELLKLIPIESFIPIIGSLIATAFALALIIAELRHRLKRAEDEAASAKSDIALLNKKHEEEITNIKELHIGEVEKFRNTILEFSNQHKETPETKFFPIGDYKWKATIFKNGTIKIDEYPLCAEHDLRFIFDSGEKCCPHVEKFRRCGNHLDKSKEFRIYQSAKSFIEKEIRNKTELTNRSSGL